MVPSELVPREFRSRFARRVLKQAAAETSLSSAKAWLLNDEFGGRERDVLADLDYAVERLTQEGREVTEAQLLDHCAYRAQKYVLEALLADAKKRQKRL